MTDHDRAAESPPSRARWMFAVRLVVVGIGSVFAALASVAALTVAEGFWARGRLLPSRTEDPEATRGLFGRQYQEPPLHLVLMGDSLAVGYGSEDPTETVGVILANELAEVAERPVQLENVARVGAESIDLLVQLGEVREFTSRPDVAVIIVGANDVMHLRPLNESLGALRTTITELRGMGTRVVLASCPDLGTVRPFFEPLRYFAHWLGRLHATSQTIVALRAGARTLSLADSLGPLFRKEPGTMFSELDHLHPSGLGYRHAAEVLLPSVRAAAGYPARDGKFVPYRVYDKNSRHPLAWLAFWASRRAGTRLRRVHGTTTVSA
jgi:lysophospholipase L1-like esterase